MKNNNFLIITYFAGWKEDGLKKLRYEYLDHINYAFAIPTEEGKLRPLDKPELARHLIGEAHAHDTKVLISVGGWSYQDVPLEKTFEKATETPEKIKRLAKSIVDMVDEYDFDGADIDWEYPRVHTAAANEALYEILAEELHKRGKLLTTAVYAGVSVADNGNDGLGNSVKDIVYGLTDRALVLLDLVHIMAYDGGQGPLHSSYHFAVNSSRMWRDTRGIPAEKLILGVPFYGRPGGSYENILKEHADADQYDVKMMGEIEAHYNGIPTIQKKTRFALEELGGIMSWEISEDTADTEKSLLVAIAKEAGRA